MWSITRRPETGYDQNPGLFRREMDSFFDDFFTLKPSTLFASEWAPSIDVDEDDRSIHVKADMPGMSDNPFDKVYLVTPTGVDDALTERLTEKAKFHFDAELCATLAEAVELAHANTRRGLLVCGSEAAALEAAALLENS